MKIQSLITLVILLIGISGTFYFWNSDRKKKEEIVRLEGELMASWDDKISDYQFLVNDSYRKSGVVKAFADSLDISYNKVRKFLNEGDLTEDDKKFLMEFIFVGMQKAGLTKEEILQRAGSQSPEELFHGTRLEVIKRLDEILNPYFMTNCFYMQDFDIWEKRDKWNFSPGDTTKLMIRLLKNYNLHSHQLELIPSREMKVIEPYLGELVVIVPEDAPKNKTQQISFKLYDWINQDTIIQEVFLEKN